MLQRIGAVIGGIVAGGIAVMAIESISSMIYEMPEGLDQFNREAMSEWISGLPVGAFLFVLAAWASGSFIGTYVARRLAPGRSTIPGLIVWAFFTIASLAMLLLLPHPVWFWFAGILACLVFGLLGLVLAAPKSYAVCCTRLIKAPIEKVFQTLARIEEFSKAVPHITKVEFLTESHYGVGTRFRETRVMNGKDASTELEVTELVENEHVRMVSDAGGTIWDTVFRVKQKGDSVEMNMRMDAIPHNFPAKVICPMILGMVGNFVEKDMDSVKEFCETNK